MASNQQVQTYLLQHELNVAKTVLVFLVPGIQRHQSFVATILENIVRYELTDEFYFCIHLTCFHLFITVYVDASDACLGMNFHLGESGTTFQRTWNVRVTQFKCDYENLAPSGCTQYYFNPEGDEGVVATYNYNNGNGMHLAQQQQTICVR